MPTVERRKSLPFFSIRTPSITATLPPPPPTPPIVPETETVFEVAFTAAEPPPVENIGPVRRRSSVANVVKSRRRSSVSFAFDRDKSDMTELPDIKMRAAHVSHSAASDTRASSQSAQSGSTKEPKKKESDRHETKVTPKKKLKKKKKKKSTEGVPAETEDEDDTLDPGADDMVEGLSLPLDIVNRDLSAESIPTLDKSEENESSEVHVPLSVVVMELLRADMEKADAAEKERKLAREAAVSRGRTSSIDDVTKPQPSPSKSSYRVEAVGLHGRFYPKPVPDVGLGECAPEYRFGESEAKSLKLGRWERDTESGLATWERELIKEMSLQREVTAVEAQVDAALKQKDILEESVRMHRRHKEEISDPMIQELIKENQTLTAELEQYGKSNAFASSLTMVANEVFGHSIGQQIGGSGINHTARRFGSSTLMPHEAPHSSVRNIHYDRRKGSSATGNGIGRQSRLSVNSDIQPRRHSSLAPPNVEDFQERGRLSVIE